MPDFNIVKQVDTPENFRVQAVKDQFDLSDSHSRERFKGEIPIDDVDWNIGVIYGGSGTGKSTIANHIWGDRVIENFEYSENSILNDFPDGKSVKEISKVLNSVGFSSPPSWLKPYSVLSTGEKMRVDIARALLEDRDLIVFDEYTSTVNRDVAKIGSAAIQKRIRRIDNQFIAVSCHDDIIQWLEPDWTFCTDDMTFREYKGDRLRRPKIQIKIFRQRGLWRIFRKYHYLNKSLNPSCHQWVGYYNGRPICFAGMLHQPHPTDDSLKRLSRLVVLPDYQGIGIGFRFCSKICKLYFDEGFRVRLITSNPALIKSFKRSDKYYLTDKIKVNTYKEQKKRGTLTMNDESPSFGQGKRVKYHWEYYESN